MAANALSKDEKARFLKALETDEEFRLAVAGKVGLLEILVELRRLREDLNKHAEESTKRFEAIEQRLDKVEQRLEEHPALLHEHSEAIKRLERSVNELRAAVGGLGKRLGTDLERLILNLYKDAIERFGIDIQRIERRSVRDVEGKYLHRGAKLEVDVYMSNEVTYLIDVKSFADEDDVEWFNTKCEVFAKELGLQSYRKRSSLWQ